MTAEQLRDALPRVLYSEYCDPDSPVDHMWHTLPERSKEQWRRVAACVERLSVVEVDEA